MFVRYLTGFKVRSSTAVVTVKYVTCRQVLGQTAVLRYLLVGKSFIDNADIYFLGEGCRY